jgi:glycosyltransferase involved in cell wall biosynthesis
MKVLHLIDSSGFYGAEKMLMTLARRQVDSGIDVSILSAGTPDDAAKAIELVCEQESLRCIPWRMKTGFNFKAAVEIADWATANGYTVLHSHGYKFKILMGLLRKKHRRIALVTTIHGYTASRIFSKLFIYKLLDCALSFRPDRVVVVNDGLRKTLWSKNNVRFIPNGIDADDPVFSSTPVDIPDSQFIVVVGRLSREKAVERAISAFTSISCKYPNLRLLIIGEGPERKELERLAQNSGESDRIIFTGYKDNAVTYIERAEALIISSESEGLPLTLLEAMRVRTPVVSTPVGGISRVLGGGEYGYLSSDTTEKSLAEALMQLFNNPGLASEKADRARNRFLEEYTSEKMNERYLELYQEVLSP